MRDSHSPLAFFHDRFVATENTVNCDPRLPVLASASAPMKPMRVSLLRYMLFSCSACVCTGAPGSEWRPLPRQGVAFLGGPGWGSQNPKGASRRSRSYADRRAREFARSRAQDQRTDQKKSCLADRIGKSSNAQIPNRHSKNPNLRCPGKSFRALVAKNQGTKYHLMGCRRTQDNPARQIGE